MKKFIVLVKSEYTSVGIKDLNNEDQYVDEDLEVSLGIYDANFETEAIYKAALDYMYNVSMLFARELA